MADLILKKSSNPIDFTSWEFMSENTLSAIKSDISETIINAFEESPPYCSLWYQEDWQLHFSIPLNGYDDGVWYTIKFCELVDEFSEDQSKEGKYELAKYLRGLADKLER